jgi:uncharacterized protein
MPEAGSPSGGTGPAAPTAGADVRHRPLDGPSALLPGGLLHGWQQRNRERSLPLALAQLEVAGNLGNVRLAAARVDAKVADPDLIVDPHLAVESGVDNGVDSTADGDMAADLDQTEFRGPVFMDSDIYKTLEAIAWELTRGAPDLADFAGKAAELLAQAQEPDGYLNSYVQVTGSPRYASLATSHELYCAGHLIQAAIASRRSSQGDNGEDLLFQVAQRFADQLVSTFLGTDAGLDGHPIVETALVELYRETGDERYLRLATQFVDRRGYGLIASPPFGRRYLQDQLPVREAATEEGHVVRALYLESGIADVAAETGDRELLRSSQHRWDDMVATKTYVTGGNGSRHSSEGFGDRYELPPDRAYNETCAAIASFQWSWRLLLATGEAKYADLMERLLYNGFAAAISVQGDRFFYVNPLQRRTDHFEGDDPGRRREWFSCACCPPNIMRFMASLEHYLATTADNAIYLHHFTEARLTANLNDGAFTVTVSTGYPWSGQVRLTVERAPEGTAGLALRIPDWADDSTTAKVNGQPHASELDGRGYLVIRRQWQPGDVLSVDFDVVPRVVNPGRHVDAVSGMAAIQRGPLVYCFEQADQPDGLDIEDLAIRSGTDGTDGTTGPALRERQVALPGIGHTVVIEADATHLAPEPPSAPAYSAPVYRSRPRETVGDPVTATAIPYFQWDNRDGRAMRVWMPQARASDMTPTNASARRLARNAHTLSESRDPRCRRYHGCGRGRLRERGLERGVERGLERDPGLIPHRQGDDHLLGQGGQPERGLGSAVQRHPFERARGRDHGPGRGVRHQAGRRGALTLRTRRRGLRRHQRAAIRRDRYHRKYHKLH